MVVTYRKGLMQSRRFWKLTGSGNDFVFFDARTEPPGDLKGARLIGAICDRRNGVGADGVVFLDRDQAAAYGIRYFNRDGTLAELCGNASLCSVSLAHELGIVEAGSDFVFQTSSGPLSGHFSLEEGPSVSMPAVSGAVAAYDTPLGEGEGRIGFARVGVPHLVVLCRNLDSIDVLSRGRHLRQLPSLPDGANANFVAKGPRGWAYRTYERGVEDETLACGSGSVAVAALLEEWGAATTPLRLQTRSGASVTVSLDASVPKLAGEGRIVFAGTLRSVLPTWVR
jgi:diaminopimelate epimerase